MSTDADMVADFILERGIQNIQWDEVISSINKKSLKFNRDKERRESAWNMKWGRLKPDVSLGYWVAKRHWMYAWRIDVSFSHGLAVSTETGDCVSIFQKVDDYYGIEIPSFPKEVVQAIPVSMRFEYGERICGVRFSSNSTDLCCDYRFPREIELDDNLVSEIRRIKENPPKRIMTHNWDVRKWVESSIRALEWNSRAEPSERISKRLTRLRAQLESMAPGVSAKLDESSPEFFKMSAGIDSLTAA